MERRRNLDSNKKPILQHLAISILLACIACTTAKPSAYRQVAAGYMHTCVLVEYGQLKCFGDSTYGQLGLGDNLKHGVAPGQMGDFLPPVQLGTNRSVVTVSAGQGHTCAILDDGSVKCWGYNALGQLGVGDLHNRGTSHSDMGDNLPAVKLGTGRTAVSITSGQYHTCVKLDNSAVKCWGYGQWGQLGIGDNGANHGVYPWDTGDNLTTVNLGSGRHAVSVTAGASHTCALLDDGSVKCWGYNFNGELGSGMSDNYWGTWYGDFGDSLPAVNLGTNRTATAVSAGAHHTCAVLNTGSVKCWGSNSNGALGIGSAVTSIGQDPTSMGDALPEVQLGSGRTAVQLAASTQTTCVILNDGSVKCWGYNDYGQLGLGDTVTRGTTPSHMGDALATVPLGSGRTAVHLSSSLYHICAVLDDDSVKCWGWNTAGQLGQGDSAARGTDPGQLGDNLAPIQLGTPPPSPPLSPPSPPVPSPSPLRPTLPRTPSPGIRPPSPPPHPLPPSPPHSAPSPALSGLPPPPPSRSTSSPPAPSPPAGNPSMVLPAAPASSSVSNSSQGTPGSTPGSTAPSQGNTGNTGNTGGAGTFNSSTVGGTAQGSDDDRTPTDIIIDAVAGVGGAILLASAAVVFWVLHRRNAQAERYFTDLEKAAEERQRAAEARMMADQQDSGAAPVGGAIGGTSTAKKYMDASTGSAVNRSPTWSQVESLDLSTTQSSGSPMSSGTEGLSCSSAFLLRQQGALGIAAGVAAAYTPAGTAAPPAGSAALYLATPPPPPLQASRSLRSLPTSPRFTRAHTNLPGNPMTPEDVVWPEWLENTTSDQQQGPTDEGGPHVDDSYINTPPRALLNPPPHAGISTDVDGGSYNGTLPAVLSTGLKQAHDVDGSYPHVHGNHNSMLPAGLIGIIPQPKAGAATQASPNLTPAITSSPALTKSPSWAVRVNSSHHTRHLSSNGQPGSPSHLAPPPPVERGGPPVLSTKSSSWGLKVSTSLQRRSLRIQPGDSSPVAGTGLQRKSLRIQPGDASPSSGSPQARPCPAAVTQQEATPVMTDGMTTVRTSPVATSTSPATSSTGPGTLHIRPGSAQSQSLAADPGSDEAVVVSPRGAPPPHLRPSSSLSSRHSSRHGRLHIATDGRLSFQGSQDQPGSPMLSQQQSGQATP